MGYVFIEIEATGNNPLRDKLVFIRLVEVDENFNFTREFSSILNPEMLITDSILSRISYTKSELQKAKTFDKVHRRVLSFLKGNILCSFSSEKNPLEIIAEEFFDLGIDFEYDPKEFILIEDLERAIFPINPDYLYTKYSGEESAENEAKKSVEILKNQIKFVGKDGDTFDYREFVKTNKVKYYNVYLREEDGRELLNFGKYNGKSFEEVPKEYLEWVLDNDFPSIVKIKITKFLENGK